MIIQSLNVGLPAKEMFFGKEVIRVIDESGEDYLYPDKVFAPVRLPLITKEKLELVTA